MKLRILLLSIVLMFQNADATPTVNAGADINVIDANGDGVELVSISGIVSDKEDNFKMINLYIDGNLMAFGNLPSVLSVSFPLRVGSHKVIMDATDTKGAYASDEMTINIAKP